MSGVLILNADHSALQTVSIKHAVGMLVREVAVVESARAGGFGPYPLPEVLRLVRYVRTGFRYARAPGWTKRGVLARDRHRCGYCGGSADTVDHIVPRSRGGHNTWTNTVAACRGCNTRKADRTPPEAGMPLLTRVFVPGRGQLTAN